MSEDIQQFPLNRVKKDQFRFIMNLPPILKKQNSNKNVSKDLFDIDYIEFMAFGNITPDIVIPSKTVQFSGQSIKLSSFARSPYENLKVDFVIDNRFKNWWAINSWLRLLNSEKYSYYNEEDYEGKNYPFFEEDNSEYMADFIVQTLDEYHNPILEFKYTRCFPVALYKIDFSYKDSEDILCSFEYAFSQFETKYIY